jgi:hypothetical protein
LLNIGYAKLLSIDLGKASKKNFRGIASGTVSCYATEIEITVEHFRNKSFKIPVSFIDSDNVDVLLGQEGFFDLFNIKFQKRSETFELALAS